MKIKEKVKQYKNKPIKNIKESKIFKVINI